LESGSRLSAAAPASADNLLPDSKLAVLFSRDGLYFQSFHDGFAKSFHASQPGRLNRERFREESRLSCFPVGPFLRNQPALLLLPDALELVHRGKASLQGQGHSLKWFCKRRTSTLSAAFRELLALHENISTLLAKREGKAAAHSLAAHALLATDPEFRYLESLRAAATELLARVPAQLTDPRSIFYFEPLASSVEAVQALTLNRFKEFALEHGGKWLGSKQAQAFFSHERPLTLVKEFSAAEALPLASMALSPRRFRTFKRP